MALEIKPEPMTLAGKIFLIVMIVIAALSLWVLVDNLVWLTSGWSHQ